jgi:flagellar hook-associated protein 2
MTIRISGFYSGLDIDQLVKELMSAKRQPLNKLNQQKTLLEWKREHYREVSSKLVDFRNNKLFNYSLTGTLNVKKAVVTGDTNAVSVKATTAAAGEQLAIKVNNLATSGTVVSQRAFDTTKTLAELKADSNLNPPFKYTEDDGKIKLKIYTSESALNGTELDAIPEIVLDVNNDTIETMIQKINNANVGVTAYLDSVTGQFSIRAKTVGASSTIQYSGPTDFFSNFNFDLTKRVGKDANVVINGIATTRSSNTFTENGMEITLNAVSASESTIRIATDTDKIVDLVKNFISDYNNILDTVNKKLYEERYRDYMPLTSEQKEEMSEKEIELWEQKAKSGLLRNDSILSEMINEFRMAIIADVEVNGVAVNLAQYGIGTADYSQRGKLLILDEDKLRAAIEEDPDRFVALFMQNSADQSATAEESGLFRRLYNSAGRALDRLAQKAGVSRFSSDPSAAFSESSNMGEELRSLNERIKQLAARLIIIENNYYKQFTAMEAAISRFNAQAAAFGFTG